MRRKYSCTISLYLAYHLQSTQCLIRDYVYGEVKDQRAVKYVSMSWTRESRQLFLINNGTGPRPRPLACRLYSFPFPTSKPMHSSVWVLDCIRICACVCASQSLWETACGGASFYLIRSAGASTTIRKFSPINVLNLIPLSIGDVASFGLLIHLKCKNYHNFFLLVHQQVNILYTGT